MVDAGCRRDLADHTARCLPLRRCLDGQQARLPVQSPLVTKAHQRVAPPLWRPCSVQPVQRNLASASPILPTLRATEGIGDVVKKQPVIGRVRVAYTGRLLCMIVGDEIRERRHGAAVGTIANGCIYRNPSGELVATMSGRFLRDEDSESQGILATIDEGEIREGVDGELLATFDGDWVVGVCGAAFIFSI
jgi:hypothetical protein